MSAGYSDKLRQKFDAIWQAQHDHPFIRGLGDGTLELSRFEVWLRQDYLYLLEYARLFTLAAARSRDTDTMKWMVAMAHGVLHNELLLHQSYAVEFGISREELAQGVMLPTTRAYADHLIRTAAINSYVELVAALLPCVWCYAEIGHRLAAGKPSLDGRYRRWIEVYSGPVAQELAHKGRLLLDAQAAIVGPAALANAEEAFGMSSRYEWMFWQMCYDGEKWLV